LANIIDGKVGNSFKISYFVSFVVFNWKNIYLAFTNENFLDIYNNYIPGSLFLNSILCQWIPCPYGLIPWLIDKLLVFFIPACFAFAWIFFITPNIIHIIYKRRLELDTEKINIKLTEEENRADRIFKSTNKKVESQINIENNNKIITKNLFERVGKSPQLKHIIDSQYERHGILNIKLQNPQELNKLTEFMELNDIASFVGGNHALNKWRLTDDGKNLIRELSSQRDNLGK